MGTCRFHLQVPSLQMSCIDLTRMTGYQDGSSNNGCQASCLNNDTLQLNYEGNTKGVSFVRLDSNLYLIISVICCLRADSRLPSSQWETSLQNNAVSHWLVANLESACVCNYSISISNAYCVNYIVIPSQSYDNAIMLYMAVYRRPPCIYDLIIHYSETIWVIKGPISWPIYSVSN